MAEPILTCRNCRATEPAPTGAPTDHFPADHCGECPPWRCEHCGQTCSMKEPCGCWIQLESLPLADIKAIFAADGTFNLTPEAGP